MMATKKHTLLLGGHVSIAGGIEKALVRAENMGFTAMQIFTKSNRQWLAKPLTKEAINAYKDASKKTSVKHVVVHASYLINIGSPNKDSAKRATTALAQELRRCEQLGIQYLIFHPGARLSSSIEECLSQIAKNIDAVLDSVPGKSMLLIENMAGQGTTIGATFEQLSNIRKQVRNKKRVGFCFDTCHAIAAGYDMRSPSAYKKLWELFEKNIGITHLKAFHLNDSKKELNSHVDRHEFINKGTIGLWPFAQICNDERFWDIPKILETPVKTEKDYESDIRLLVDNIQKKNSFLLKENPLARYKK